MDLNIIIYMNKVFLKQHMGNYEKGKLRKQKPARQRDLNENALNNKTKV